MDFAEWRMWEVVLMLDICRCGNALERIANLRLRVYDSGYASLDSTWSQRAVCSPYTRLYFVSSGEGFLHSAKGERHMIAGCSYLVPSGLTFDYRCDESLNKLYFHVILEMPNGRDLLGGLDDCLEARLPPGECDEMLRAYKSDALSDAMLLNQYLFGAIARFLAAHPTKPSEFANYSPVTEEVFRRIRRDLSSRLRLRTLAESMRLSDDALGKRFKSETGITISECINDLLIRRIQQELLSTEKPLSEISDELGFCDQFYMSRFFKKRQGETPSAYRKRLRGII